MGWCFQNPWCGGFIGGLIGALAGDLLHAAEHGIEVAWHEMPCINYGDLAACN